MTYCVGIKLDAGLVFMSDSRTNAGLDQISIFRKMIVYEKPGDRFMTLLSAGNLSISQSVREILQVEALPNGDGEPITIWNATSMFDAARVLGAAVRRVYENDGPSLKNNGMDFVASFIFGGQIGVAAMTRYIAVREQFHSNMLGLYIQKGSWLTDHRVRMLAGGVLLRSTDGLEAQATCSRYSWPPSAGAGVHTGDVRWIRSHKCTVVD